MDRPGLIALADWRLRVADLYARVRDVASRDPRAGWELWREARERLYREHPQSPVPVRDRARHQGRYWPYDPGLRFSIPVAPAVADDPPDPVPMSLGDPMALERIGSIVIPFESGPATLALFWIPGYAGGIFLPFRDATNGAATYGAGRYLLDGAKGADLGREADGRLILDFNFAYQPSCAFDPEWACPLAPPGNRLGAPIEAGERVG